MRIARTVFVRVCLFTCLILLFTSTGLSQVSCGIANSIQHPVDINQYTLTQDFAAPSLRHQGRFHTGEDWYGGRNSSLGEPVYAAARGRVTYSWDLGWGRDGGVVIIEHVFPDGRILYTQYGHIAETETVKFPGVGDCVEAGEMIARIGDSRPAPHVHFEIRSANPTFPGPGYTWDDPRDIGWLDPTLLIARMQAELEQ